MPSHAERDNARFIILLALGFLDSALFITGTVFSIPGSSITSEDVLSIGVIILVLLLIRSYFFTAFPGLKRFFK